MRILLIDDSQLPRLLGRAAFEDLGFEVLEAGDGQTGLELARSESPDLIFLDLWMPGMDGREVLRALQQANIPVVVLTADEEQETRDECLGLGAKAVINKPRNNEEFVEAFRQVFPDETN